jgi:hypothetical protein
VVYGVAVQTTVESTVDSFLAPDGMIVLDPTA